MFKKINKIYKFNNNNSVNNQINSYLYKVFNKVVNNNNNYSNVNNNKISNKYKVFNKSKVLIITPIQNKFQKTIMYKIMIITLKIIFNNINKIIKNSSCCCRSSSSSNKEIKYIQQITPNHPNKIYNKIKMS